MDTWVLCKLSVGVEACTKRFKRFLFSRRDTVLEEQAGVQVYLYCILYIYIYVCVYVCANNP